MPGIKKRKFERDVIQLEKAAGPVAKPRAAIYSRVSTEEQAQEGFSLSAQEERLGAYVVSRDWIQAGVYADEGASGRDVKRDQYQKMIAEIDQWDVLVVPKMDRIHRNARNFLMMMDLLEKRGKQFVSTTESLDTTTAMGRFVMSILAQIAQLESEQIGERTTTGMSQAVKEKMVAVGTRAPFGYRWKHGDGSYGTHSQHLKGEHSEGKPSELVLDPENAPRVRKIFAAAAKGASVQTISQDLLKWCDCKPRAIRRRYPLKSGKIKEWVAKGLTGDCGGCTRVRYVLQNPAYLGYFVWGQTIYPGAHEPLVTRAIFEKYNQRRRVKVQLPKVS